MQDQKLVVHLLDGRTLRGHTADLQPDKEFFEFHTVDGEAFRIRVDQCKAVFVVRTFDGFPKYEEDKKLPRDIPKGYTKLRVEFKDGERIVGKSLNFQEGRPWFWLEPADPHSNNLRIFIPLTAIQDVRVALY